MIRVQSVSKNYGSGSGITCALKDVTADIDDGSFTVILGASGSGKSTLLNVMSGLERVDSGKIIYDDTDLTQLSDKELTLFRRRVVGLVFQQYYLIASMSVQDNVRMGAELATGSDYKAIIKAIGLEDKLNKFPSELSGGEQQRVAIARALAKKPTVLFADEPTGALDEETGRQILDYIDRLHKESNLSVVMVTHNANIADMADKVIYMNSGRVEKVELRASKKSAYEIDW
ncbi:MAG: ABC transporter ATP-binding protein [Clostridia bacterium]|nr:ABC transporter ATP-binding protein [Clostridia bacterium]